MGAIALRVKRMGEEVALLIPPDVLARLGVVSGDTVNLIEDDGGFHLSRAESDAERQLRLVRDIMAERREVLARLAR